MWWRSRHPMTWRRSRRSPGRRLPGSTVASTRRRHKREVWLVTELSLAHGFAFADLYGAEGLARLDAKFRAGLPEELRQHLEPGRQNPPGGKDESALLIELAPHVEDFIGELFGIRGELQALAATHHALAPIFTCKRLFVQRQALKAHKPEAAEGFDGAALQGELETLFGEPLTEAAFARHVGEWEKDTTANAKALDIALRYAAWATLSAAGRAKHATGVLFKAPRKLDPMNLVPLHHIEQHGVAMVEMDARHRRRREGFKLTDPGMDLIGALDQTHYCIFCHHQGKDSCSRGLKERDGTYKKSVFGVTLAGCPLEEKISEMHELKAGGVPLGALAMIVVDNPMAAATGHRICNDCMRSEEHQSEPQSRFGT